MVIFKEILGLKPQNYIKNFSKIIQFSKFNLKAVVDAFHLNPFLLKVYNALS